MLIRRWAAALVSAVRSALVLMLLLPAIVVIVIGFSLGEAIAKKGGRACVK